MTNTYNRFKKILALLLVIMVGVTFTPAFAVQSHAADGDDLTLALVDENTTTYMAGKPILVKATGTKSDAWVGLYKKGEVKADPLEGGTGSLRWFYVAEHDGEEVDITKNAYWDTRKEQVTPGEYELVLFGDGGYSDIRKIINIIVIENPDLEPEDPVTPSEELTLQLADPDKTAFKIGEPINIKATGTASGAWVGLYKAEDIKADPKDGGSMSMRWYYTADHNGEVVDISSMDFDLNNKGSLTEGAYDIVLFGDGGYDLVEETIQITIEGMIDIDESQFTLEVEKTEYKYGEDIRIKATGKGINDGAWVGFYPAGTTSYEKTYMYYYNVKDYEGVFTKIQNKTAGSGAESTIADGIYDIILFADGGYSFPVKKVTITVTRATLSKKVLREPGCMTFGLEYVVFEDGSAEYREIPTLGGHLWKETPVHIKGKTQHEYACQRNENHTKKVEDCSLVAGKVLKAATRSVKGKKEYTCSVCKGVSTLEIPKLKAAPVLKTKTFTYNGKNRKPAIKTLYDTKGKTIPSKFYTVSYPKNCKNVGTYTATVKFKGDYSGTYKLSYKINPKSVALSKLTKGKKSFKATWKKAGVQTTGYQIKYSTDKNFKKNVHYKKIKKVKTTSTTVKNLKAKKKYYVKVRTYKVVKNKTYYSSWSSAKYVTTK